MTRPYLHLPILAVAALWFSTNLPCGPVAISLVALAAAAVAAANVSAMRGRHVPYARFAWAAAGLMVGAALAAALGGCSFNSQDVRERRDLACWPACERAFPGWSVSATMYDPDSGLCSCATTTGLMFATPDGRPEGVR